jgi:UDPglucose--hexose-1-phosphate uridylyltransferase
MSRLRFNPFLGEFILVVPHRSKRPFQEEGRQCPFCPGQPETKGQRKVLTIPNRFPSLTLDSGLLPLDTEIVMEAPAYGLCKVIILSRNHNEQIEHMDKAQLQLVFNEYLKVFKEIDNIEGISYVYQFENRGKSIGVSLNHPHAQVYAFPFIPPLIEKEIQQFRKSWEQEHTCMVCQVIENESKAKTRIIQETTNFISVVPFFARLPYEVHVYTKKHVSSLIELEDHLLELGQVVQDVIRRYSSFFDENAYVMAFHTRPSKNDHPYWHFHIEIIPPWRDKSRIKYLAGVETGTGTYTNDSLPEISAQQLREAI